MNLRRPSHLAPALILLAAPGCEKDPVIEVIPGVNSAVEVVLVNPTDCPVCDPFAGVDTLKLEVSVGGDVVASDSYAWPGEEVTLPDLTQFGVVRITLLGLADGRVISAGRTAEVVLLPDVTATVPLVFLPANRALPLAAPMISERYDATAIVRRGGEVLVVGGLDPIRRRATPVAEVYDPATGTFVELGASPTAGARALATPLPEGDWLLSGGYAIVGENTVPLAEAVVFDDDAGTFIASGALSQGRTNHCLALFRDRQGLVLGGAAGEAEYLKPDADSGAWAFTTLEVRDFDAGAVTECVANGVGSVFAQGRDATSTGVWSEDASDDLSEAFRAINEGSAGDYRYVEGAVVLPADDGTVRILGGADVTTGEVYADGRLFSPDARRFTTIDAFQAPRFDPQVVPWLEDGWYVGGCGWADADRATGEPTIELLAPFDGQAGPRVTLDRDREGCALATLRDGSVLVVGGGPEGVPDGAAAALVVPWLDLADAE